MCGRVRRREEEVCCTFGWFGPSWDHFKSKLKLFVSTSFPCLLFCPVFRFVYPVVYMFLKYLVHFFELFVFR